MVRPPCPWRFCQFDIFGGELSRPFHFPLCVLTLGSWPNEFSNGLSCVLVHERASSQHPGQFQVVLLSCTGRLQGCKGSELRIDDKGSVLGPSRPADVGLSSTHV